MDLPGPAPTAVGVAMIRATETGRTDRLYEDPWAQLLRGSGWTVDVHDFGAIAADYGRPGIGEGAANVVALR